MSFPGSLISDIAFNPVKSDSGSEIAPFYGFTVLSDGNVSAELRKGEQDSISAVIPCVAGQTYLKGVFILRINDTDTELDENQIICHG